MNVPLYKVYWDEDDVEAVSRVIRRGTYWSGGKEIEEFEEAMADRVGRSYGVAFNSGTSAILASLLSCEIESGKGVIIPSFTFSSSANAPHFVGSVPVFADIEEETLALDVDSVFPRLYGASVVMLTHYAGKTSRDVVSIRDLTDTKGAVLIEDAAEALGGYRVGCYGDIVIVSLCGNKIITTGEGGVALTDDPQLHSRLKKFRSHGDILHDHNWRMSSITAALGLSQLGKVDDIIKKRRTGAVRYEQQLGKLDWVVTPSAKDHIFQFYTVRVSAEVRNKLMKFLTDRGVSSKVYFPPIHLEPFYKENCGHTEGMLPITEKVSSEVLSLPLYPDMPIEEIDYVSECVKDYFSNCQLDIGGYRS